MMAWYLETGVESEVLLFRKRERQLAAQSFEVSEDRTFDDSAEAKVPAKRRYATLWDKYLGKMRVSCGTD